MFRWWIDEIRFSGGETIAVPSASVFLLIGPNSSGKSTVLRDLPQKIGGPATASVVLEAVEVKRLGEEKDFRQWLYEHYPCRTMDGIEQFFVKDARLPVKDISTRWARGADMATTNQFLIHRLDTEGRLQITRAVQRVDLSSSHPSAYIHVLQADDRLLGEVSAEVERAFGKQLIINWTGAGQVWFHVGTEPSRSSDRDRVSHEYASQLNRIPKLEEEGDGIRSFVGTLLAARCGSHPVLIIDEPEAFLHPAQARRLASLLAQSAGELKRQVILATHSTDVVKGAVESGVSVTVCRIARRQNVNHATSLPAAALKELWSKPLLRSGPAIDGLFHEAAVVCEGPADSHFYQELMRLLAEKGRLRRTPDVYFAEGGGKGELASLAASYHRLGVSTAVIADIDLLRNASELRNVVEALGGSFATVEKLHRSVSKQLEDRPPVTSVSDLLEEMERVIREAREVESLSPASRRKIVNLVENSGPWSEAKKYGVGKLTGGAHQEAQDLLDALEAVGLFIVRDGELECWWRAGSADKAEWLRAAVGRLRAGGAEFRDALAFMERTAVFLGLELRDGEGA